MSTDILTLSQEIYFDLCDLLDNNGLAEKIEGFYEFEDLRDFIHEQKQKISQIERYLDKEQA